jgi:hypothetical protein
VTVTQVPLSGAAALLIGLAALAVVVIDAFWLVIRYGMVMAHEGAHAATAALLFRKVIGIKLNADATGETARAAAIWPGNIVIKLAGYLGPSLFGLAAAKMIELGRIAEVLWVALFLLVLLAIAVRTAFGVFSVLVAGGLVFLLVRYTPMPVQIVAAYAIAWLLLLSGVRGILEDGSRAGDAHGLRDLTFIPRFVWFLFWLGGTLTAILIGGKWLVLRS